MSFRHRLRERSRSNPGSVLLLPLLLATIPAFYQEVLHEEPARWAPLLYLAAFLGVVLNGLLEWRVTPEAARHHFDLTLRRALLLDVTLGAGLLASALMPPSSQSGSALMVRLFVSFLTLARMLLLLQPVIVRGRVSHMLLVALVVLFGCGVGYWFLEPTTPTLADGLWLAFVTASTIGYGDMVPTTPASKIFSVFVLMLGFGVLSLLTASIAAHWMARKEEMVERDILDAMRGQIDLLRQDIAELRAEVQRLQPDEGPKLAVHPRRATDLRPPEERDAA